MYHVGRVTFSWMYPTGNEYSRLILLLDHSAGSLSDHQQVASITSYIEKGIIYN